MVAVGTTSFIARGQESAKPAPDANPTTSQPTSAPDAKPAFEVEIPRKTSDAWKRFSELPVWDDGFSEMSYYDATCTIYDKKRKYTRVHLMNRQTMDPVRAVKTKADAPGATPAFKFIATEEIPTENYNYRFLTSAFFERPSLEPIKVTISSQEWCGTTFKWMHWSRLKDFGPETWSLDLCWYSYFGEEGDQWRPFPRSNIDAYETLFVYARAVVAAGGEPRRMHIFKSMHSNHAPDPTPLDAILRPDGKPREITVPLGTFKAQRVVLDWKGDKTWFDVETSAPYRILAFRASNVDAKLRFVERRAYWNRKWKSGFYEQGKAP
jgi:hypothetical protein